MKMKVIIETEYGDRFCASVYLIKLTCSYEKCIVNICT